jgi:hypothetical protein
MSVDVQRFATDTAVRTYTSAEIDALIAALGATYLKLDCSNDPLIGDLNITGTITTTGVGSFGFDTDTIHFMGRSAIGGIGDYAYFTRADYTGATDYALAFGAARDLYVKGTLIDFWSGAALNVQVAAISQTGFLIYNGKLLQIDSLGADKHIQISHNDVNGLITSSDGTISFDNENLTTSGEVNVFNNIEILGNYYLRFRDLGDTTTYLYMMATSAMGGGGYISAVNIPFELRYGALGSVTQLSMDTNGNIVWNYGAGNCDFTICKNAMGQAYVYDAGLDTHTFSGYATFEDGWRAEEHSEMVAGRRLYFDGA